MGLFNIKNKPEKEKEKYEAYKLSKGKLYSIAESEGLSSKEQDVYVKFMNKRFPQEAHESYAREWAVRFKSGKPQNHMDSESLKAYEEAKEE